MNTQEKIRIKQREIDNLKSEIIKLNQELEALRQIRAEELYKKFNKRYDAGIYEGMKLTVTPAIEKHIASKNKGDSWFKTGDKMTIDAIYEAQIQIKKRTSGCVSVPHYLIAAAYHKDTLL